MKVFAFAPVPCPVFADASAQGLGNGCVERLATNVTNRYKRFVAEHFVMRVDSRNYTQP